MALRYDEIGDILKLIDESSCDEFILETDDIKLAVRRRIAGGATTPFESAQIAPGVGAAPTASSQPAVQTPPKISEASYDTAHVVSAPMVGTFYRAPSPGAPPFVDPGTKVKKGDAICIIEVMKLFTTIHAEWSGTVTQIGPENAQLVEYGQMLFVISPD
jgi:acetyl-CoA carboxylase biotin carboxyl carrier protein